MFGGDCLIKMKFDKKDSFQKKPYSLVEGLEVLAEVDAGFVERNQKASVFLEIFDPKDKDFGYRGSFELGVGKGDSFFDWLETTLTEEFPENPQEINAMLERMAEEVAQQVLSAKEHATNEKKTAKKERKLKKRSPVLISGVIVFLLVLGGAGTYFLLNSPQFLTTSAVEVKETFEEDLQLLSPVELGEKYPDRLDEIAGYYKDQQQWEKLESFQEIHPTTGAAFDLAFYAHDWDTVIQTEVTTLTKERKIMLCYAYIEKNKLTEATLLAKKLDSAQLSEALDRAYLRQTGSLIKEKKLSEAEEVGKNIQSDTLQTEYQEAIDSASIMNEMIELYNKQNDTKNKEMWERRLNDLGTVLEERGQTD